MPSTEEGPDRWVGRVEGTDALVAVALEEQSVVVYVCGKDSWETRTGWFASTLAEDAVGAEGRTHRGGRKRRAQQGGGDLDGGGQQGVGADPLRNKSQALALTSDWLSPVHGLPSKQSAATLASASPNPI
jgi:hypothetical protein